VRQLLLQTWLLNELTPDESTELLSLSSIAKLPTGTHLTEAGRRNDAICIVMEGEVVVQPSGFRLQSGDMLGEMSWLDGQPASATTVAGNDAKVLLIPHARMNDFVGRNPESHIQILRKLAINLSLRLRAPK